MKAQSLRRTLWIGTGLLTLGLAAVLGWFFVKVRPAHAAPAKDVGQWLDKRIKEYNNESIVPQVLYPVDEKKLQHIVRDDLPKIDGKKVGVFVGPMPPEPTVDAPAAPVDTGPKGLAEIGKPTTIVYNPPRTSFFFQFSKEKKGESFRVGEQVPKGGKFTVVDVVPVPDADRQWRFVYEWVEEPGKPPKREEVVFDLAPTNQPKDPIGPLSPPAAPPASGTVAVRPTASAEPAPSVAPGEPPPLSAVRIAKNATGPNAVEFVFEDQATYDYFTKNKPETLLESIKTDTAVDAQGRARGIKVTGINAGSVAERFDIRAGDILVSVAGQPVHNRNQVIEVVKKIPKDTANVPVVIERNGRQITYNVDPRDPDTRRGAGRLRFK
jgi:hypothetical protein